MGLRRGVARWRRTLWHRRRSRGRRLCRNVLRRRRGLGRSGRRRLDILRGRLCVLGDRSRRCQQGECQRNFHFCARLRPCASPSGSAFAVQNRSRRFCHDTPSGASKVRALPVAMCMPATAHHNLQHVSATAPFPCCFRVTCHTNTSMLERAGTDSVDAPVSASRKSSAGCD